MTTLVVDWLGRGGIAQYARAWADVIPGSTIVSRAGRELDGDDVIAVPTRPPAIRAHLQMAVAVTRSIERLRPRSVIFHNHLVPALERRCHDRARSVGAKVVFVVHDHRFHSRLAGTTAGLRRLVARADVLVVHSNFVGAALRDRFGRDAIVVDHPLLRRLVDAQGGSVLVEQRRTGSPLALHFGVVKRGYKGAEVVSELSELAPGWDFAIVGVGARASSQRVECVDRFAEAADLVATIRASDAVLLPYRFATQSGAIQLAQSLARPVVASAVGGIPEQIVDGSTGLLIPPSAAPALWLGALERLDDPRERERLGARAREAAAAGDERFRSRVATIL